MCKPILRRMLVVVALLPLLAYGDEPWLLSFPSISYDARFAYFSNDQWTAIYLPVVGNLTTVPTDSLNLPSTPPPSIAADLWGLYYRAVDQGIMAIRGFGDEDIRTLPAPTPEAVDCLPQTREQPVHENALRETAGPLVAGYAKIWFGLLLRDTLGGAEAAGVGWYDPTLDRFGRIYSPSLSGFRPFWIGVRSDSVYLIASKYEYGEPTASRIISVSAANGGTTAINLRAEGVPGAKIVAAAQWGDTLLFSTERAAAVWKPHRLIQAWESRSYASPQGCWIYWKTFPGGDPEAGNAAKFQILRSGTPTDVRAKVGRWFQVIAPAGVEGYVDPSDWEANQGVWSDWRWNCYLPCLARIYVPMEGEMVPGDVMNVMMTYLGQDDRGVKIGFHAAWAREEDLAPVMMSTTPPRESE